jgi:DNA-binding transcriptional LysR family regulator
MISICIGDGYMEVRQLQIFRALAEELNFTRTAERVHTVQSNVTAQIKALEEELGAPLFDRLGRRVTLTDSGRRFQPFADQALKAMEQGQQAIQSGGAPSGPLTIGAPESVLTYRLPPVLRMFRRRFPHVEVIFRPYSDANICSMLETGKLDMAIQMSNEKPNSAFASKHLWTEKVFLLADASHSLGSRRTVHPVDLGGQMLLLTESGCGYRTKLDQVLALQNVRPANVTEFSSVEAIKQCAVAGMGLALLPAIVATREIRQHQLKVLAWAGPSLDITTRMIWHKNKWISPAMAAFQELIQEKLESSESTKPRLAIEGSLAV